MKQVISDAIAIINKLAGSYKRGWLDHEAILQRVRQWTRDPKTISTVTQLMEEIDYERN